MCLVSVTMGDDSDTNSGKVGQSLETKIAAKGSHIQRLK